MNIPTSQRVEVRTKPGARIALLLAAVLSAVGTWLHVERVLIPQQVRYDTAHSQPRGNLSDLYPRWLGARELLLHGRDPYTLEFTREIQTGYYGRPLDSDGKDSDGKDSDGKDSDGKGHRNRSYDQGFYYPAYVAFFLAPTIHLPFAMVQKGFFWVLLGLTLATIPLWPRIQHWPLPLYALATLVVFTVGSLTFVEGLLLQQITLFVVPVMAVALALLVSDYPIPAGILLAFCTIKPQLVCWLLLWLTIWTLADWRRRYRWAVSFLLTMAILCAASEWYLPHWIPRFYQALREYRSYTGEMSVTDELIGPPWSRGLEVAAVALLIGICWRERRHAANTGAFAFILSLVLAVTVLVTPTYGIYNQLLLIPALLILLKDRRTLWQKDRVNRFMAVITVGLVCWPWISAIALAALSFVLPRETVEPAWPVPLWTTLQTPLAVTALMLLYYHQAYYQRIVTAPASLQSS